MQRREPAVYTSVRGRDPHLGIRRGQHAVRDAIVHGKDLVPRVDGLAHIAERDEEPKQVAHEPVELGPAVERPLPDEIEHDARDELQRPAPRSARPRG